MINIENNERAVSYIVRLFIRTRTVDFRLTIRFETESWLSQYGNNHAMLYIDLACDHVTDYLN